jgi:hypothetical protein
MNVLDYFCGALSNGTSSFNMIRAFVIVAGSQRFAKL